MPMEWALPGGPCLLEAGQETAKRHAAERARLGILCCGPQRRSPMPMPNHHRSRKRVPKPDRRRALELLASCRDGCTESMMLAPNFTIPQLVDLVRAGLATATAERVVAGNKTIEIARVRITEARRRALHGALS
jgi:hypothetical protein